MGGGKVISLSRVSVIAGKIYLGSTEEITLIMPEGTDVLYLKYRSRPRPLITKDSGYLNHWGVQRVGTKALLWPIAYLLYESKS